MQVFHEIERTGNLYPYYDYAHGYGIPQASKALLNSLSAKPSFEFSVKENIVEVKINTFVQDSIGTGNSNPYLYFHIQGPEGYLERYSVIKVQGKVPFSMPVRELEDG